MTNLTRYSNKMNNNTFTENEVKELVILQTQDIIEKFNNHFSDDKILFEKINILFNLKGCRAGVAYGLSNPQKLRYNLQLAKENLNDFLENTIPHEIIHLYQRKIYPNSRSHGKEFKFIGQTLGYNTERCHYYDVSTVKRKSTKYLYTCDCGANHWVSTRKHNQILTQIYYNNHSSWYCAKCKSYLTFTGKTEKR